MNLTTAKFLGSYPGLNKSAIGLRYLNVVPLLLLVACSAEQPPSAGLSPEAQLIQTGSQAARMCVGCHGPQGISRVTSYPSIAGLPQPYLAEQLHAFRSGARENPMMSSIAKSMDEDDILALSHYFSSLPGPLADSGAEE